MSDNTPDAPWNQYSAPKQTVDCELSYAITLHTTITSNDYNDKGQYVGGFKDIENEAAVTPGMIKTVLRQLIEQKLGSNEFAEPSNLHLVEISKVLDTVEIELIDYDVDKFETDED